MQRVPPEIISLIIEKTRNPFFAGFLPWDTYYALSACSLVCKSWTPLAQAYLFENLHITADKGLDRFLAFLENTPHVAVAVRSLSIRPGLFHVRLEDVADLDESPKPASPALFPTLLMNILSNLPALSSLYLERMTLLGWPRDTPLPTVPVRLRVLTLFVLTYKLSSTPDLMPVDFLTFFELDELRLLDCTCDISLDAHFSDVHVLPVATQPVAKKLDISGHDELLRFSIERGCGGVDPKHVESVVLCPGDMITLVWMGTLLRLYRPYVRHICLSMTSLLAEGQLDASLYPDLQSFACNMSECSELESLHFIWEHYHPSVYGPEDQQDAALSDAYAVVLSSAPKTLRELRLSTLSPSTVETLAGTLRRIAPLIVQTTRMFSHLLEITLVVRHTFAHWLQQCMDVLRPLLPAKIVDSGVIRLECVFP
ncbi:hypothetical protein OH77DRAFT_1428028 [Trametes cingulata]|nr:hypothetical protein OH77DRAFT_1428028 [Trametes cingulata]